jgi:hypothetical protein
MSHVVWLQMVKRKALFCEHSTAPSAKKGLISHSNVVSVCSRNNANIQPWRWDNMLLRMVSIYESTRRHNPEERHRQHQCCFQFHVHSNWSCSCPNLCNFYKIKSRHVGLKVASPEKCSHNAFTKSALVHSNETTNIYRHQTRSSYRRNTDWLID